MTFERKNLSRLTDIPNVGKATAADLRLLGIDRPSQLVGKDPIRLYDRLCDKTGQRHDPCVLDVFLSAVHFMDGGPPRPWWTSNMALRADGLRPSKLRTFNPTQA